ncbi:unnamed protein product [Phytophthora fragariaefolia]|uniref:Unnamed protein product n=1 Tax=Phytophthora fragariaefolia TaxID=1490495 RepID=A0A9W7CSM9_9STRA|nr:unnamed protein product [Phytophthora fragariaefolia]
MLPTKFRKLIWVKRGFRAALEFGKLMVIFAGSRPAAFDDPSASTAWTQGDAANEEEEDDEEDAESDAAGSSSKGLTMVADRFAQMKVNRNRRKGHFDDDEEEEEDSDDDE